jgi:UrcA family protein
MFMHRNTRLVLAVSSVLMVMSVGACAEVATAAQLVPRVEIAQRHVKYGDLDLSRAEGAATLYGRIHAAARDVCRPSMFVGKFEPANITQDCMKQAIENAVNDVDAPTLTSYHLAKTGRTNLLAQQ